MILPSFQFTNGDRFKSAADAYVWLALIAIEAATHPQELRDWWSAETKNRIASELTDEHEQTLIAASKAKIAALGELPPLPKPEPKKKAKPKRRAAI